jgi:phosphoglucosamine mutase
MSNLGLENYLNKLGIKLVRTNVGDINVITEMKKNSYVLGGEQSGHIILGNYLNTADNMPSPVFK